MVEYEASYTTKDLILYALSLGMGSRPDDASDLRFLYERDSHFTAVPTFCFAFTFWAERHRATGSTDTNTNMSTSTSTQTIPPFPPPIMADEAVIPPRFLRDSDNIDLSAMPVIHTWQSIVWHRPLEVPKRNSVVTSRIRSETIAVQPKSIGTFVTSQSIVSTNIDNERQHQHQQRLCTIQSTALVLGMDPKNVVAFDAGIPKLTSTSTRAPKINGQPQPQPLFEWTYQTPRSQALLYRIASGDSNHIHVDTSASDMLGSDKKAPLLHGLFTLALAFRAIVKLFDSEEHKSVWSGVGDIGIDTDDRELVFRKLEGAFKAPGFVGDRLCVKIWDDNGAPEAPRGDGTTKRFLFVITNTDTGVKMVDSGCAEVEITSKVVSSAKLSRL
eukprot:jgi/Psemu1/296/gm1.296_g